MSDEKIKFDDLGVTIGQSVDVLPFTALSKSFVEVTVIGAILGESLIFSAAENSPMPPVKEGEKIIFRIKLPNGVAIFATNILFIATTPMTMVYVDIPKDIAFKRIRGASRVSVSLPVIASNAGLGSAAGIAGRIVDISTTGVGLELFGEVAARGEEIILKGKFAVGGIQRLLSVRAIVRKVKEQSKDSYLYGVEILEDDENQLLVLFGFIFNAMAFGKIQKIR